jgi:hypothetical protein
MNPHPLPDIIPGRPLVVCDADEVLLQFLRGLERALGQQDLYLDLSSYAISGNVKRTGTGEALTQPEVSAIISTFHAEGGLALDAVEGAALALEQISRHAQIVILTNIGADIAGRRRDNLTRLGMNYPVVPNSGLKGPALQRMAELAAAPVFFIDDIPQHHAAVAEAWPDTHQIHFVADPRLFAMAKPSPHARLFSSDWSETGDHILSHLT